MFYRIIDLIIQEDTFGLFTHRSKSGLFSLLELSPRIETAEELRARLFKYFNEILLSASPDSVYFNEASRMIGFLEKVFGELKELGDSGLHGGIRDPVDDLTDLYIMSLNKFVEGIEVLVLQEHVKFISS